MELLDSAELKKSQMALIKQRGLDTYLDKDLSKFQQKFDRLVELLNQSANNENFEEAFQIFYVIIDAVPLLINYVNDIPIFRAQTNKPNEIFNTQSRISYNKSNPEIISPGKFNVYYDPMFYGSMPYRPKEQKEYCPPSLTAALETCKDLYNPNKVILMQDFTIGRWKMNQTLNIVNLCFDEVHLSYNHELKEANKSYIDDMKVNYTGKAFEFIRQLFEYYSVLCRTGRNERAYYILTALFAAIRVYYEKECHMEISGMISSSAATEGRGLNIVMTPDAVDKYLILDAVRMERYFLIMPEAIDYAIYPCSELIVNHMNVKDFNYTFKNYIRPADRFLERMKNSLNNK